MYLVLGASGHVGSAVARALLAQSATVTVILHNAVKGSDWQRQGARVAVADVHNEAALRRTFRQGQRLFLLNPPAAPATDTAAEERRSLAGILAALPESGLEKIVAESTYGVQPGNQLGDLGVLYELEQALATQPIPASIIRAAYYYSNWDASLATAQREGTVHTLYPPDFKLPMVAPADISHLAARLLTEPVATTSLHYLEGPARYSAADVAAAFGAALHRPVAAVATPREQWVPALQALGFSAEAAVSMANMTGSTLEGRFPKLAAVEHGTTSLPAYVAGLVRNSSPT